MLELHHSIHTFSASITSYFFGQFHLPEMDNLFLPRLTATPSVFGLHPFLSLWSASSSLFFGLNPSLFLWSALSSSFFWLLPIFLPATPCSYFGLPPSSFPSASPSSFFGLELLELVLRASWIPLPTSSMEKSDALLLRFLKIS